LGVGCAVVVNVSGPAGEVDTNTVVKMREYGGLTPGGTAIEVRVLPLPLPPRTHVRESFETYRDLISRL
jgi:hypothetical protein